MAPQQHPVQGAGARHQALAVGGGDHLLDQLVHNRVMDADDIAAAGGFRGLGAPVIPLFVAR